MTAQRLQRAPTPLGATDVPVILDFLVMEGTALVSAVILNSSMDTLHLTVQHIHIYTHDIVM